VLSQIVSKLITSTHRHIQCVRSSIGVGTKVEQCLTANAVHCALLQLQELTVKFRASQNAYLLQLNSREERSQKYFDDGGGAGDVFTNVELGDQGVENFVDSFDNLAATGEVALWACCPPCCDSFGCCAPHPSPRRTDCSAGVAVDHRLASWTCPAGDIAAQPAAGPVRCTSGLPPGQAAAPERTPN